MTLRQFYDWKTLGGGKDVSTLVAASEERGIPWCMIGGLAVNHWAHEPMATADVGLAIAAVDQSQGPVQSQYPDQHRGALPRFSGALRPRLVEAHPELQDQLPSKVSERLEH